jgi:hypothetical protein
MEDWRMNKAETAGTKMHKIKTGRFSPSQVSEAEILTGLVSYMLECQK